MLKTVKLKEDYRFIFIVTQYRHVLSATGLLKRVIYTYQLEVLKLKNDQLIESLTEFAPHMTYNFLHRTTIPHRKVIFAFLDRLCVK